jgi:3-hydroxy-3-methylglutaryl CoA synthase
MAGIVSYGAYVPLRRLGPGTQGWNAPGEKAVANWDEDSLTMAVAAAIDCLGGIDRETIDGLYFATTTPPYGEKMAATTAAWAADLRPDILTADITDSLRAGTAALRMAAEAVKAEPGRQILVTASDLRIGAGGMDAGFGDGAAALLIGDKDIIATIEASYSLSNELLDVWRASGAKQVRSWEDRFVFEEGYLKILPQAVKTFFEKSGLTTKDFTKAVFYGPDLRRHRQMAGLLGFKPEQVQEPFFDKLGNTGTAFTLMMLVAALEDARPGDKILLASYGDGADVFLLKVTEKIKNITKPWGMKRSLASKMIMPSQGEYHAYREFATSDPERSGGASASIIARERDAIYTLYGVKCLACGTVQYPPQRICTNCHAKDNFEPYRFADKKGKVFTFTLKYGADIPAFACPGVDTMVDFEGGGRAIFGMTDMIADKVKVGMDVEMSFRTLGAGGGIRNYFWRCMPPRESWLGKEAK